MQGYGQQSRSSDQQSDGFLPLRKAMTEERWNRPVSSRRRCRRCRRRHRPGQTATTSALGWVAVVAIVVFPTVTMLLPTWLYADDEAGFSTLRNSKTDGDTFHDSYQEGSESSAWALIENSGRRFWSRRTSCIQSNMERDDADYDASRYHTRQLPSIPAFILSHDRNRRRLQQSESAWTDSFHMIGDTVPYEDDVNVDAYSIGNTGVHHTRSKSTKSEGKGHGKGSGKGKGKPSYPTTIGYPQPPNMPPDLRPSNGPPRPSSAGPPKQPFPVVRPTNRPPQPSPAIPTPSTTIPPPQPPPPSSSYCQVPITLSFLQFSAIPPALVVLPADPNPQDLGTRYVYNNDLRDVETLDELVGSRNTGVCTRTQSRFLGDDEEIIQLGGGHCSFTYTLFDGEREFTFEVSGDVVDTLGGTLSITGGTKDAVGAFGEIELLPVRLNADGSFDVEPGDFFLEPIFYLADAVMFVPCG